LPPPQIFGADRRHWLKPKPAEAIAPVAPPVPMPYHVMTGGEEASTLHLKDAVLPSGTTQLCGLRTNRGIASRRSATEDTHDRVNTLMTFKEEIGYSLTSRSAQNYQDQHDIMTPLSRPYCTRLAVQYSNLAIQVGLSTLSRYQVPVVSPII